MAYDPDFWNNNKQLVDQGIGNQPQGSFPTHQVDPTSNPWGGSQVDPTSNPWGGNQVTSQGVFPGTNNTVDPASSPWGGNTVDATSNPWGTIPVDATSAVPGTDNQVDPTANPWSQTQTVDPAANPWGGNQVDPGAVIPGVDNVVDAPANIPITYPGGQNDGSLLDAANQNGNYSNFGQGHSAVLGNPSDATQDWQKQSFAEQGGGGYTPQDRLTGLNDTAAFYQQQIDAENAAKLKESDIGTSVSLNKVDEHAPSTNNLLAAAAAKKKKTQAGLKSFGGGLASLGESMMEGGYEYDFLGGQDKGSIYG